MKIGICDDIRSFCDELQEMVEHFVQDQELEAEIVQYPSGEALLADKKDCDILFLDLKLEDTTGLDVLRALKEKNAPTIVLVVTAYSGFIDEAMNYRILRFIEKPVEEKRIFAALKKAVSLLNEEFIVLDDLKTKAKYRLRQSDIICAETKLRKIYVYTAEQTFVLKEGFKAFKTKLCASCFAETHYSYVVNMNYIKCFKRTQLLLDIGGNDKTVPVSGEKQSALRKKYAAFLGEDYGI